MPRRIQKGEHMSVDIEELRSRLMDYYGTASWPGAQMELIHIQNADAEEIIEKAEELGWL